MMNYRKRMKHLRIVESKDFEHKGHKHRTIVFEYTAPDKEKLNGHYTVVLANEIVLLISSHTKSSWFKEDKKDFDKIVASATFEEA